MRSIFFRNRQSAQHSGHARGRPSKILAAHQISLPAASMARARLGLTWPIISGKSYPSSDSGGAQMTAFASASGNAHHLRATKTKNARHRVAVFLTRSSSFLWLSRRAPVPLGGRLDEGAFQERHPMNPVPAPHLQFIGVVAQVALQVGGRRLSPKTREVLVRLAAAASPRR